MKVLAILGVLFVGWWMYPYVSSGRFLTPSPVPANWWGYSYPISVPEPRYDVAWTRFDVWHSNYALDPNPTYIYKGESVERSYPQQNNPSYYSSYSAQAYPHY